MNQHQVLTGAVNSGDYCYSVGSVEGVPFTVYAAGCNIVILSSDFERVQIIAGVCHGNVQVTSLDCANDVGKIAAAYAKKISIFESSPLLNVNSLHKLDYRWIETASLDINCHVNVISWNISATRLLLATEESLQLWTYIPKDNVPNGVKFTMGEEGDETCSLINPWAMSWSSTTSSPVHFLKFADDGTMFATAGRNDRLAKVWYETCDANGEKRIQKKLFSFTYLSHPRAVTALSWRHTSKYLPRNCVANMLVTSCRDNICRLWCQTLLPEDGLINFSQIEAMANQQPKVERHRNKIMNKLKHIKSLCEHKTQKGSQGSLFGVNNVSLDPLPSLPSSFSINDFHNFSLQGSGVAPGVHFHLAASINAESDIPLVPAMRSDEEFPDDNGGHFVLHWLNNKEIFFSRGVEKLLHELSVKTLLGTTQKRHEIGNLKSQMNGEIEECQFAGEEDSSNRSPTPVPNKDSAANKLDNSKISHSNSSASDGSVDRQPSAAFLGNAEQLDGGALKDTEASLGEALEKKLEALLKQWHKTGDLLFSVHPIDGSFLVWVIEYLDESVPGAFRQPQVSFMSRISNAISLGDAATMSQNISLYLPTAGLDLKTVLHGLGAFSSCSLGNGEGNPTKDLMLQAKEWTCTPTVSMISKHANGSLNLWYLTFSDEETLTQVLSVTHSNKRVCGHRFRINDITCHPTLPLLLTTSHHNSPQADSSPNSERVHQNGGFCSELILWKVESVGPLSKSGGITELARINSFHTSAFSNVAWVPTLLPSWTLGMATNSPSACFVASDGERLRVYQALIDARSLLAELVLARKRQQQQRGEALSASSIATSLSSLEDGPTADQRKMLGNFGIVSQQSTARPGCIIELDPIVDACADWQNTQLLHVFQECLIFGGCKHNSLNEDQSGEAYVDLQDSAIFREPFYLVVIEKKDSKSIVHMWRLIISSSNDLETATARSRKLDGFDGQSPDSHKLTNGLQSQNMVSNKLSGNSFAKPPSDAGFESRRSSRSSTPEKWEHSPHAYPLRVVTKKVCEQTLPLPDGVEIVHAEPAAGHLSSSNIYPACLAPYLITTACTDGKIRFWNCDYDKVERRLDWREWRMMLNTCESDIEVDGYPLAVCAAYSGRVAVAFKLGSSFTRPTKDRDATQELRYVNLAVAIYECESTGGSEWVLEDTIRFRNVQLPRVYDSGGRSCDGSNDVDLISMYDANLRKRVQIDYLVHNLSEHRSGNNNRCLMSAPSYATLQTLKKSVIEQGNQCVLIQKSLMQLDWVSSEDGSHILTVALGPKIMLYAPVSHDIAQCNVTPSATSSAKPGFHRPLLKQRSSMAPQMETSRLRWMQIRGLELRTADGLPALPMQLSWVRDGILVVGMDNEMHVYSQWKPCKRALVEDQAVHKNTEDTFKDPIYTKRCLHENNLMSRVQETQLRVGSSTSLTGNASFPIMAKHDKNIYNHGRESAANAVLREFQPDFGLFETSRFACPVLPQYHPKQLMELLAFGKIKRVKAILAHLVRCLRRSPTKTNSLTVPQNNWSKSCAYPYGNSGSHTPQTTTGGTDNVFSDDLQLDYVEIVSIPPLPLYKLLEADTQVLKTDGIKDNQKFAKVSPQTRNSDLGVKKSDDVNDYSALFDETVDGFAVLNEDSAGRARTHSASERVGQNLNHFGTHQASMLTQVLTHCSLPGLSNLDQVHLLALADSVASFQPSITERFSQNVSVSSTKHASHHSYVNVEAATEALDDSGLRYLLATRHHTYLMRCLPLSERAALQKQGLGAHSLVWAFHSETQDELIQLVLNQNQLRWADIKDLGVGWWCKSNAALKRLLERVAKSAFQSHQNPLDASFYYMALKKKNILTGLFRSVNDKKMTDFFQNNFNEDRWRRAALKNAYALLGKQKFKHAAAFFLLANDLKSAVQVCLNNLDDLQLAMVLVRLYDGGEVETYPETLKPIVFSHVLGCNEIGDDYHASRAHPDPFIRSMAFWLLKRYEDALSTLLHTDIGCSHPAYREPIDGKDQAGSDPAVFNFYLYLRTHPFVVRRNLARLIKDRRQSRAIMLSGFTSVAQTNSVGLDSSVDVVTDTITPLERRLFFTTAHAHFRAGCPPLALEVLSRLPNCQLDPVSSKKEPSSLTTKDDAHDLGSHSAASSSCEKPPVVEKANDFDWSQPLIEKAADFDWSQPEPQNADAFDWSQPISDKADDFNWSQPLLSNSTHAAENSSPKHIESITNPTQVVLMSEENRIGAKFGEAANNRASELIDVMAQQLKFIACLKIMMEELSTLSCGFEASGGLLRLQLYVWLERCVSALRRLCHYGAGDGVEHLVVPDENEGTGSLPDSPKLRDLLLQDKKDFEAKLERATRRKRWLKANEALLRTLLSYSALHGAHGGALAVVRMELNVLLQELQQTTQSGGPPTSALGIAQPLLPTTTLPLVAASIAYSKTVVADPVRLVQSLAHDILYTITADLSHGLLLRVCAPFSSSNPTRWGSNGHDHTFKDSFGAVESVRVVCVVRDLSFSLSACIYQALCDSDRLPPLSSACGSGSLRSAICGGASGGGLRSVAAGGTFDEGMPTAASGGRLSSASASGVGGCLPPVGSSASCGIGGNGSNTGDPPLTVTSAPSKWPGVQSLRALMSRDRDDDSPRLHTLLCEAFVAVYMSLTAHALATRDASMLFRLVAHRVNNELWTALFGGGAKKMFKFYDKPSAAAVSAAAALGAASVTNAGSATGLGTSSSAAHVNNIVSSAAAVVQQQATAAMSNIVAAATAATTGGSGSSAAPATITGGAVTTVHSVAAGVQGASSGGNPQSGAPLSQQGHTAALPCIDNDSGILDAINRQRLKWNMKLLPQFTTEKPPTSPPALDRMEARPTYKEVFVPPTQSIMARLMSKPHLDENLANLDYDSSDNIEDDGPDDEWKDDLGSTRAAADAKVDDELSSSAFPLNRDLLEDSFSWGIMNLSATKLVLQNLTRFLQTAGIEFCDLPVASPLIHASLKALQHWYNVQREDLDKGHKPVDFLPNMAVDELAYSGPAIHKYKVLLDLDNTPFQRGTTPTLRAARRLWNYLVRQEECQEYFIKYIFSSPKPAVLMASCNVTEIEEESTAAIRPIRVIHKDQESIAAFCVNRSSGAAMSIITVATSRDMQELDISRLLDDAGWMENEAEFDILNWGPEGVGGGPLPVVDYLVIEHPIDKQLLGAAANPIGSHASTPLAPLPANSIISSVHPQPTKSSINLKSLHFPGSQHPQFCEFVISRSRLMVKSRVITPSGKPPIELKKHKVDSVRRLAAHPNASLYLSGGQDGAVHLWEWGLSSAVCSLRLPGTRPKVTSVSFNAQGNKLGVTDGDGWISLWQVGVARTNQTPFFTTQCHSKQASEFAFAGSSSLLATGGQSSDGKNVCLWDTLLPQRKAMIGSFHCHEHGCSALLYAPHSGLLISAGKKGDIAITDVRQRVLQHKFQAHDSAVKCLSLDPNEEYFVSGSADGDIKVWNLPAYAPQYTFKGEHSKNSLFRSMASGVTNLYVDDQSRLFSCGADGSLKLRQLPKPDSVVQTAPY